jgi:hypothetical protein
MPPAVTTRTGACGTGVIPVPPPSDGTSAANAAGPVAKAARTPPAATVTIPMMRWMRFMMFSIRVVV